MGPGVNDFRYPADLGFIESLRRQESSIRRMGKGERDFRIKKKDQGEIG